MSRTEFIPAAVPRGEPALSPGTNQFHGGIPVAEAVSDEEFADRPMPVVHVSQVGSMFLPAVFATSHGTADQTL
jgi:hypothetical protein